MCHARQQGSVGSLPIHGMGMFESFLVSSSSYTISPHMCVLCRKLRKVHTCVASCIGASQLHITPRHSSSVSLSCIHFICSRPACRAHDELEGAANRHLIEKLRAPDNSREKQGFVQHMCRLSRLAQCNQSILDLSYINVIELVVRTVVPILLCSTKKEILNHVYWVNSISACQHRHCKFCNRCQCLHTKLT